MVPVKRPGQSIAQVAQEMPTVRDLNGLGRAARNAVEAAGNGAVRIGRISVSPLAGLAFRAERRILDEAAKGLKIHERPGE